VESVTELSHKADRVNLFQVTPAPVYQTLLKRLTQICFDFFTVPCMLPFFIGLGSNPDNPAKIATKALRHKAKPLDDILFFGSMCLGGENNFSCKQRNQN